MRNLLAAIGKIALTLMLATGCANETPKARGADDPAAQVYAAFVDASYPFHLPKIEMIGALFDGGARGDPKADAAYLTAQKEWTEKYYSVSKPFLSSRWLAARFSNEDDRLQEVWILSEHAAQNNYSIEIIEQSSDKAKLRIDVDEHEVSEYGEVRREKLSGVVLMILEDGQWKIDGFSEWSE